RDIRYSVRMLGRARGFTTAAILTLALGIGANAAVFSVVNAVLLQPLPYADPDRLVQVGEATPDGGANNLGYMTYAEWRVGARGFDELALVRPWSATLVANGEPERIVGIRVSANYFRMLGVRPAIGRDFRPDEDTPDRWRLILLSDGLWRRRFAADPSVVGRIVTMNDSPYAIVGVMPASFEPLISEHFYQRAEMWSLLGYDRSLPYACRSCQHLKAFGRVKASTSIEAARADLEAVHARMRAAFPNDYAYSSIALVPLQQELVRNVRPALRVLMGAVVFVLIIACGNVASLLIARLSSRERDLALRTALGAGRYQIVRQLLVESTLLAIAGGVAGIFLASWAVPLIVSVAPAGIARLDHARMDIRALLFAFAATSATAVLFGLWPALRAARIDLQAALHSDGRKTARGPVSRARRLLVAADVALAVVLLAGAGLMIKSVGRLLRVDPGFDPNGVLTMQIQFVGAAYADNANVVAVGDRMIAKLRALPGVDAVAFASQIPLGGNGDRSGFSIQGRPVPQTEVPSLERYGVTA
ncbi:MAG TPA: ABC transporter permease, partial [Vicinamibacterales bacterium]|nr:ABC transporter permease [Vicinamibacterales bacterium]